MERAEIKLLPEEFIVCAKKFLRKNSLFMFCVALMLHLIVMIGGRILAGHFGDLGRMIDSVWVIYLPAIATFISGINYEKMNQAEVIFNDEEIQLVKQGKCFLAFAYRDITSVCVGNVERSMGMGRKKSKMKCNPRYICLFKNGATKAPESMFQNQIAGENYCLIAYSDEALQQLTEKLPAGLQVEQI